MTPDDLPLTPEEEDLALAGEYALGLLEGEELRAAEARLASDPAFRAAVARWSEDLAGSFDGAGEVPPPAAVEGRLMRRLFPEERRPGLLPRLLPWLGGAVAAGLAAFGLFLVFPPGGPEMQARMAAEDESLVVMATYDEDTRRLEIEMVAGAVPEGRDYELWVIKDDRVRSLGVIPHDERGVIEVSVELAPDMAGGQLALTDEPPGGSPTGVATGPIVAAGPVTEL